MRNLQIKPRHLKKNFLLWVGIFISLCLSNLIHYLLNPQSTWWDFYREKQWFEITLTIVLGIVMYYIILFIIRKISIWFDKYYSFSNNIILNFTITTSVIIVCMFCLIELESIVFSLIYTETVTYDREEELSIRNFIAVNVIVAAFVNNFYLTYLFFEKWKAKMVEANKLEIHAHQLKENALQSELEVLKLQLDPHFLFNNFSILMQLINTNPLLAKEFLSNLSNVYRYILTTIQKDVIVLQDELDFVEQYFHLIKIRHGESIRLKINLSKKNKSMGIPPVTLQLLIENAIKHNISTHKRPLDIFIESYEGEYIVVKNNLQPININYKSTKMGLQNIIERYHLLHENVPEIIKTDSTFEVKLPLLNL